MGRKPASTSTAESSGFMLIPVYEYGEVVAHTIIDDQDFVLVSEYRWRLNTHGYAATKSSSLALHRLLMNPGSGKCIDHINRDKLDNRRGNLRICSHQENQRNRPAQKNNTSGFKGVSWHAQTKKWRAGIVLDSKLISLGCFNDKIDAAKAYNAKAKELFGEFAWLNPV